MTRFIIALFFVISFMAKANDSARSYFEEGRDFNENPLAAREVIDFYQNWLWQEQGRIEALTLQTLIPVKNGFIVHFSRKEEPRYFYMQVIAQDPESLIDSPWLNSRLRQSTASAPAQENTQKAYALVPMEAVLDDLIEENNQKPQSPLPQNEIEPQQESNIHQAVQQVQQENHIQIQPLTPALPQEPQTPRPSLTAEETSEKEDVLSDVLLDLFPAFAQRDFQQNPLSLNEVNEIYKVYHAQLAPSIRSGYQGAAYDKQGKNIILTFKGGLSGKIFEYIITPNRPNSLIIE